MHEVKIWTRNAKPLPASHIKARLTARSLYKVSGGIKDEKSTYQGYNS